jgi:hypothetical protein
MRSNARLGFAVLMLIGTLSSLTGCAVFFGQIQPIEQPAKKSLELPKLDHPWESMPSTEGGADVSYQNRSNGSTLSFTSGCRLTPSATAGNPQELERLASSLSGGISRISSRKQSKNQLDGTPALDSIIEGKFEGKTLIIRSRVARKDNCVYDVTLVCLKRFFDSDSKSFDDWASRIRLP